MFSMFIKYELEGLVMIANIDRTKKNILQDNNGKHAPLATN